MTIPALTLREAKLLSDLLWKQLEARPGLPVRLPASEERRRLFDLGLLAEVPAPKMSAAGRYYVVTERGRDRILDPDRLMASDVLDL